MKKLGNIWKTNNIGRKTKAKLFKIIVISVLLYECETWKLTKGEEEKLDIFQTKFLRRIFKIRCQQHVTNETILQMARMNKISSEVRRRRWNWIGHLIRRERNDDYAIALGWTPEGRRKRGRPKTTLRRMVESERNHAGWRTWTAVRHSAADRQKWRMMFQPYATTGRRSLRLR